MLVTVVVQSQDTGSYSGKKLLKALEISEIVELVGLRLAASLRSCQVFQWLLIEFATCCRDYYEIFNQLSSLEQGQREMTYKERIQNSLLLTVLNGLGIKYLHEITVQLLEMFSKQVILSLKTFPISLLICPAY